MNIKFGYTYDLDGVWNFLTFQIKQGCAIVMWTINNPMPERPYTRKGKN